MPRMHGEHRNAFAARQQAQARDYQIGSLHLTAAQVQDLAQKYPEHVRIKDGRPQLRLTTVPGQKDSEAAIRLLELLTTPRQLRMACRCRLIPTPHFHNAGEYAAEHPVW